MDLRAVKTKRSIHNAFLSIRSKKALERVTVKEICDKAEISKATFYLHYKDIYDLSEQLQQEVIDSIVSFSDLSEIVNDIPNATMSMINGYFSNKGLVEILFSGSQFSRLPEKIENGIKELLFRESPELKNDVHTNVRITYQLMGCFYAVFKHEKEFGIASVMDAIDKIVRNFANG